MNILDWDESENPYEHISVKHKRYIGAEAFKKELSEILPGCYSELHGATRTPEGVLCIGRLTTPDDFLTDELSKNPPIIIQKPSHNYPIKVEPCIYKIININSEQSS